MKLTIAIAAVAVAIAIGGCVKNIPHVAAEYYGSCAGNQACMRATAAQVNSTEKRLRIQRVIAGVGLAFQNYGRALERRNDRLRRSFNRTTTCVNTVYGNTWTTRCR